MEAIKILVVSLFVLSPICFFLAIIGLFKPEFVIRRPSMQTKARAFFLWAIASASFFTVGTMLAGIAAQKEQNEAVSGSVEYYVGSKGANIRECPDISCGIMDTISPYTKLTFKSDPFSENPEWARYVFSDGSAGYVSKVALSNNPTYTGQSEAGGGSSSIGGIVVGPWSNIQAEVGGSYEFHFCEPPSAISGATCGGLADTATNPTGGRPPYSFFKKSGFLPPGMALELNGTFSGSPTQAGTFNFRLCAKDLYGGEGCQNIAVVVGKNSETSLEPSSPGGTVPITSPSMQEPISISVTSAICGPKYAWDKEVWPEGKFSWGGYSVEGNVSGPVGAVANLPSFSEVNCDSWTKVSAIRCQREAGQSPTTHWSIINKQNIFDSGAFTIKVDAWSGDYAKYDERAEAEAIVVCS